LLEHKIEVEIEIVQVLSNRRHNRRPVPPVELALIAHPSQKRQRNFFAENMCLASSKMSGVSRLRPVSVITRHMSVKVFALGESLTARDSGICWQIARSFSTTIISGL